MPTVLVADDDPGVRELLKIGLELAGYEVLVAPDGDAAWSVLQARRVEALVTDLHLPGRDGLALVGSVRRDDRLRELAVVVVTGDGDGGAGSTALNAGADSVVRKPFSIRAVPDAVAGAIAARTPADAPA